MGGIPDNSILGSGELGCLVRSFLNGTLEEITRGLAAERCSLFLLDAGEGELVLEQFYGLPDQPFRGLRRGLGDGIAGEVLKSGEPVLVADIGADPRFRGRGCGGCRSGSFISVPLYVCGTRFGIFNFSDKSGSPRFTDADFRFASALGSYACRIIGGISEASRLRQENYAREKENGQMEKYSAVGETAVGLAPRLSRPLAEVQRLVDALLSLCPAQKGRRYLGEIRRGLERIEKITGSLLGAAPVFHPSGGLVGLEQLLEESIDSLKIRFDPAIRVSCRYAPGLPAVPDIGLEHVFVNIMKNAIEAMPGGGELGIEAEKTADSVRIIFTDTGPGIPSGFRSRIFDPFFTTKEFKGTGLGLSISREIVRLCTGEITAETLPGKGSRFSVVIPLEALVSGKDGATIPRLVQAVIADKP